MTVYKKQMEFRDSYDEFVDKFKPKKTTDDCYTPPNIYETVKAWAMNAYGIEESQIVRPFWPGADFEAFDYSDGCVVLDNPPFSIISKIIHFYIEHKVRYFLFAHALTLFNQGKKCHYVICGNRITFQNGAGIPISYITSEGDALAMTAPDLYDAIETENAKNISKTKKVTKKVTLPMEVVTAARMQYYTTHHTPFKIYPEDCEYIRKMDCGYNIFGSGFLLSERAAAERAAVERAAVERAAVERAAAERAAVERMPLSAREKDLVKRIGKK